MVPDSWYIHALITLPEHRGSGLGSRMMSLAQTLAESSGCALCSLLVLNSNTGAIRLYERLGYQVIASEPIVKDGWENPATDWLLMTKHI